MGKHTMESALAGLLAGLAWGLGVALMDGLPLLWHGTPWPYLGERLVALAYLATLYGLAGAVLGGILGAAFAIVARLVIPRAAVAPDGLQPPVSTFQSPVPYVLGILAAGTLVVAWGQRFQPGSVGWLLVAILAAAAGAGIGWLVSRFGAAALQGAAPAPTPRPDRGRRALPIAIASLFLLALLAVISVTVVRGLQGRRTGQAATVRQPSSERPNIVLITADGIRADHLGPYGYDPAVSPNLNALAAHGVRFDQAVAPASWGRPSAASLLTSLYPSALGYRRDGEGYVSPAPDPTRTTIAEALKVAGYKTGAILASQWLNASGFAQGFDTFDAARGEEPFDEAPMRSRMLGGLLGCRKDSAACRLYLQGRSLLLGTRLTPHQGGEAINARADRFLNAHASQPFFLWVHYDDAIPPFNLAEPFTPIAENPLASPVDRLKNVGYWQLGDPFTIREQLLPLDGPALVSLYDGHVQRFDRLVGDLLSMLDARGLADRTIVVVASDHGQELEDHGGYTYGRTLYNEIVRVPLILAGAGVTATGQAVTTPVSLIDLAPTLAELAGTTLSAEAQGVSLVPALEGRALNERPIYSEALYRVPFDAQAIQSGGFKLIYNEEHGQTELYDLATDPAEQHDITVGRPDVVDALSEQLQRWKTQMRDLEQAGLPQSAPYDPTASKLW